MAKQLTPKKKLDELFADVPDVLLEIAQKNRIDAMCVVKSLRIVEFNDLFLEMFGYSRKEFRDMEMANLFAPVGLVKAEARYLQNLSSEASIFPINYDCIKKNGELFLGRMSIIIWPTDPTISLVAVRDVTKRRQNLVATQEREELYRSLAETMPAGVVMLDPQGKCTFINDEACEILGCAGEKSSQDVRPRCVHNEQLSQLLDSLRVEDVPSGANEIKFAWKDSPVRWLSAHWQPINDYYRNTVGTCIVFYEITEHKLADQALLDAENKYRLLVETTPDLLWQVDNEDRVTFVSQASRRYGYEPDEVIGQPMMMFIGPDHQSLVAEWRKLHANDPNPGRFEIQLRRKDGFLNWVEVTVTSVTDERGDQIAFQGVARDITKRKHYEAELVKANEQLTQAYNTQAEFVSNITHDIRTPLTAVRGYVSMLLEGIGGSLSEEQKMLLRRVMRSSDNLLLMVSALLDIARMRNGQVELCPETCRPFLAVRRAAASVRLEANAKGVDIKVVVRPENLFGLYDEGKLSSVLTNILVNAVKFTDSGDVQVICDGDSEGVEIIVIDPGIGIAETDIESIFEEFKQLSVPQKSKPDGFGIGLAIVAKMVEAMGATLIVSSAQGVGTAFTLKVPVLPA